MGSAEKVVPIKDDAATIAARTVAGTFDITLNLTDRRGIKMTGYVYSDDTPTSINQRLDQFQDALDRQAIRSDIVNKEAQLAGHIQNLEAFKRSYDELLSKRDAGGKLTSQEKNGLANFEPGVKHAKEAIESLRAAIKAAHDKLAA